MDGDKMTNSNYEDISTSTNMVEDIKKQYENIQKLKPFIIEICVTDEIQEDMIIILDKYLVMKKLVFEKIKNIIDVDVVNNTLYGIPIHHNDKKYYSYIKEGFLKEYGGFSNLSVMNRTLT